MLHIATVHYGSPRWIEIQTRYIRRHISVPHTIWSSLQRIDASHGVHFDRIVDQAGPHSNKLNHLAIEISHEAQDDDLLMFLDGDAFPITDPLPFITEALDRAPLVAVRRAENVGEKQPHPLFCVTTVKSWRELHGDWSSGYRWLDDRGRRITDVGGNLLRELELTSTPWVEVLRSNRTNVDPVYFGLYGDLVYHHGAGFREGALTFAHFALAPAPLRSSSVATFDRVLRRLSGRRKQRWEARYHAEMQRESERIYARIARDDPSWLSEFR